MAEETVLVRLDVHIDLEPEGGKYYLAGEYRVDPKTAARLVEFGAKEVKDDPRDAPAVGTTLGGTPEGVKPPAKSSKTSGNAPAPA